MKSADRIIIKNPARAKIVNFIEPHIKMALALETSGRLEGIRNIKKKLGSLSFFYRRLYALSKNGQADVNQL